MVRSDGLLVNQVPPDTFISKIQRKEKSYIRVIKTSCLSFQVLSQENNIHEKRPHIFVRGR